MILVATALAWTKTGEGAGCTFFKGPAEGAVEPVRAECDWDVPAARLHALLARSGDHDEYFTALVESTVTGRSGSSDVVYQRHRATGISDREVVLLMGSEPIPGGTRYTWTKAPAQTGLAGLVLIELDTGKWEVTGEGGRSHVVYELRYLAGGSVPGFVVRWFQVSGVKALLGELADYARAHP